MSKAEILDRIRKLPDAERREVVEAIEAEFGSIECEIFPGEAAMVESRLHDHARNPGDVVSLEEVKSRLDAKYRK